MSTANVVAPEIHQIESLIRANGFNDCEAYRYNSVSLRLRVRDARFQGLSRVARMQLLEPVLKQLSDEILQDLIFVLPIAPAEEASVGYGPMNFEFEHPRPSTL